MSEGKVITIEKSPVLSEKSAPKVSPKSGEPFANNKTYFKHSSGNFNAGTWDCTAGSWEHNHPKLEFCYIVEGSVKIVEEDSGITHTFNAGESFVVPRDTRVTWIVEKFAKKIFVSAANLNLE